MSHLSLSNLLSYQSVPGLSFTCPYMLYHVFFFPSFLSFTSASHKKTREFSCVTSFSFLSISTTASPQLHFTTLHQLETHIIISLRDFHFLQISKTYFNDKKTSLTTNSYHIISFHDSFPSYFQESCLRHRSTNYTLLYDLLQ